MDNLDSKRDLNKYIYNYMKKRNLHSTAEIFSVEANISPNDVDIDSDEEFLTEWWSIFWSVFNTRHTDNEEVRPQSTPSSDLNRTMFEMGFRPLPPRVDSSITMSAGSGNVSFPTPSFNTRPNQLGCDQTVQCLSNCYPSERVYKNPQICLNKDGNSGSSCWRSTNTITGPARYLPKATGLIIKSPDSKRLVQEQLMLPFNSNVNSHHTDCGVRYLPRAGPIKIWSSDEVPQSSVPVLGLSPDPATLIPVADVRRVSEQEHIRVPAKNDYFNPDRVSQLLSSSPIACGHAQKNKKRLICDIGADDKYCCAIRKSSIAAVEPQIEPPSFSAASVSEQVHHGFPQMDLDSNAHLLNVGQLSRLLSAPTKFNYTQQNAHKEGQCCVTRDEGLVGTTSRRYVAAEPTHQAPKAIIQPKMEPAEADDD